MAYLWIDKTYVQNIVAMFDNHLTAVRLFVGTLAIVAICAQAIFAGDPNLAVKVKVDGKTFIGRPLAWDGSTLVLLRRTGQIKTLSVSQSNDISKHDERFRSYSDSEIASQLLKRFRKGYEVTRTGRYVVVHPEGKADQWAKPFEELYGQFLHYFHVRGFSLQKTEFPLIVIVFSDRSQFIKVASQQGVPSPERVAGYYSPISNQVITYVQSGGLADSTTSLWDENRTTLVHEALHQYAFNVGIHGRGSPNPKWASEGLACMFEAPGVSNSRKYPKQSHRVHKLYLREMKRYMEQGLADGFVEKLVRSDKLFTQNPPLAYCASWSLMFYLAENDASSLNGYLRKAASRPAFRSYSSSDRVKDFARYMGTDFKGLESRVLDFLKTLD